MNISDLLSYLPVGLSGLFLLIIIFLYYHIKQTAKDIETWYNGTCENVGKFIDNSNKIQTNLDDSSNMIHGIIDNINQKIKPVNDKLNLIDKSIEDLKADVDNVKNTPGVSTKDISQLNQEITKLSDECINKFSSVDETFDLQNKKIDQIFDWIKKQQETKQQINRQRNIKL